MSESFITDRYFFEEMVDCGAAKFTFGKTIQFASGMRSPGVKLEMNQLERRPDLSSRVNGSAATFIGRHIAADLIAAVATGATTYGAVIAYKLRLPLVVVKKNVNGKSMGVEGDISRFKKQRALVIEDVGTTFGTALAAARTLGDEDIVVRDILALGSYGFTSSGNLCDSLKINLYALFFFEQVLDAAVKLGKVDAAYEVLIRTWLKDPWAPWEWPR